MSGKQTRERARRKDRDTVPAVSAVLDSGGLAEMVIDMDRKQTRFAVWRDGARSWEAKIENEVGRKIAPYAFDHALLRSNVVRFAKAPEDYGSQTQLVEEVRTFLRRYVGLSDGFEKIASYYVLFTWVYDRFNDVPYLRVRGDYGSGKSRFLQTIGAICHRPIFASGASTVSPIFHLLDLFGGTLIVDEADFRSSDEKADMVKIFNNGSLRGMPVLRSQFTRQRDFEPQAFRVFGPKIVATRGRFEDQGLESRFLTEEMGAHALRNDIPINLPLEFEKEALALRNKLLMFRFRNWKHCKSKQDLVDDSIEPRLNQMLVPLLSIIDDSQERDALRSLAKRCHRVSAGTHGRPQADDYRWEACA